MLTLKAAGLVDIEAGELITPGVLRIEGDQIAAAVMGAEVIGDSDRLASGPPKHDR